VLEATPGRDQAAGEALWQAIPAETRSKVEAAAMDMHGSYVAAAHAQAPQAAIAHDKFNIAKMFNEAVDQTRRAKHVRLQAKGDDTLKGTRYQWLHGVVPERQKAGIAVLLEINLQTAKAWCYKEKFAEFWAQPEARKGRGLFRPINSQCFLPPSPRLRLSPKRSKGISPTS
jgi:transposase